MIFRTALRLALPLAAVALAAGCDDGDDLADLLDGRADAGLNVPEQSTDVETDDNESGFVQDGSGQQLDRVTEVYGVITMDWEFDGEICSQEFEVHFVPAAEPTGCAACDLTFVADLEYSGGDCGASDSYLNVRFGLDLDDEGLWLDTDDGWQLYAEGFVTDFGLEIAFEGSTGWVEQGDVSWRDTVELLVH